MSEVDSEALLPLVAEAEADADVARLFTAITQETRLPLVPNLLRSLGLSAPALAIHGQLLVAQHEHAPLPGALAAMISYVAARECGGPYSRAWARCVCRQHGVSGAALAALDADPAAVRPRRSGAALAFAARVARDPAALEKADIAALYELGISSGEIVAIVQLVAVGRYLDTLAQALHVPPDACGAGAEA